MVRIDELAAFLSVIVRKQSLVGDANEISVAEVFVPIGEGQLYGFDAGMDVSRAIVTESFEIIAFKEIQCEKLGGALVGRRVLINLVTAIIQGNGAFEFCGIR